MIADADFEFSSLRPVYQLSPEFLTKAKPELQLWLSTFLKPQLVLFWEL